MMTMSPGLRVGTRSLLCCSASGFDADRRCKLLRRRNTGILGGKVACLTTATLDGDQAKACTRERRRHRLRLPGERRECATAADRLQAPASSSIRSVMRCAPSRSCSMVQSAAWPPVTSRGRALLTSRPVRFAGQLQLVLRHGDEACAKRVEPEPRPARLADPRVQVLHPVETARGAALGRKHPHPALPGKATALGRGGVRGSPPPAG